MQKQDLPSAHDLCTSHYLNTAVSTSDHSACINKTLPIWPLICHDRQNRWFFQFHFFQKWYPTPQCFECWRLVVSFIFYTCGKACQCPLYSKCLYFSFLLVFKCYYCLLLSLIPFLPGYPLLNHFTLLPSVVCILFFFFISPSTFCIHLLCLHITFHLFICNPSFLACIIHCPFCVYLLFPLLWLSNVFHLHTPYLYVVSGFSFHS